MNSKIVSSVVALFVLVCGAFAYAAPSDAPVVPTVAAVLPDATPVDLASAPSFARVQVATPVVIVGKAPKAVSAPPAKRWVCGAPQGLSSDYIATVRHCEWL